MESPPTIAVLGLGNWGTALANHLAHRGFDVLGWCIEQDIPPGINFKHINPRYQSGVQLHPSLHATNSLDEAVSRRFVVLVVPSNHIASVASKLLLTAGSLVVSAVKGLESETLLTPLQFLNRALPQGVDTAVLSGPSFARDVAAGKPCGVVAAAQSETVARKVAEVFSGHGMRVYTSTDTIGVELGGVVKNVIALAVGVCDGLGLGDSARAGLITRGLAEMTRLAVAMGGDARTLAGLSGLGDLAMTATCDTSRNRTVGLRLGKGEKLADILKSLGSVAEAVHTTPLVLKLAAKHKVEMPISEEAAKILSAEISPQQMVENLLSRPLKREIS